MLQWPSPCNCFKAYINKIKTIYDSISVFMIQTVIDPKRSILVPLIHFERDRNHLHIKMYTINVPVIESKVLSTFEVRFLAVYHVIPKSLLRQLDTASYLSQTNPTSWWYSITKLSFPGTCLSFIYSCIGLPVRARMRAREFGIKLKTHPILRTITRVLMHLTNIFLSPKLNFKTNNIRQDVWYPPISKLLTGFSQHFNWLISVFISKRSAWRTIDVLRLMMILV